MTFKLDSGQTTTIPEYFRTTKNYVLKHGHLPVLWVGSKTREQKMYLPAELCTVLPGQVTNTKMTENQTRNMIRYSATDTKKRKQKIMDSIKSAGFNQSPCVREFGFSVEDKFTQVEARVLQPPDLGYEKGTARVQKGVWRVQRFLTGTVLKKWTILNLDQRTRPDALENLAKEVRLRS